MNLFNLPVLSWMKIFKVQVAFVEPSRRQTRDLESTSMFRYVELFNHFKLNSGRVELKWQLEKK